MSLIPALVSRSKWKISKTDIHARPRAAASKNSDNRLFSRGKEDREFSSPIALPASLLSFFTIDRSIHPSRFDSPFDCFSRARSLESSRVESSRIESSVKQSTSKTWDRIGLESAPFLCPPRAPLRGSCLSSPTLQPPLPQYRFVGHYRELPMENVIDSVYPAGRNDTQILWKSWGYPGSIEKERARGEACRTRRFTQTNF